MPIEFLCQTMRPSFLVYSQKNDLTKNLGRIGPIMAQIVEADLIFNWAQLTYEYVNEEEYEDKRNKNYWVD